jgi:hypothetical protein
MTASRVIGHCRFARIWTFGKAARADLDVFYEEGTPQVVGADSLGAAVSP